MNRFPNFPFRALVFGHETTITGIYRHGCVDLYQTQGCGLVGADSITPLNTLRNAAEMARPAPRRPRAQGFFKSAPLTSSERRERAARTRAWLYSKLCRGPLPAREVLRRAKGEGFNEWSLRRAKKRAGVKSYKAGGKRQGWGAVWYWSAIPA